MPSTTRAPALTLTPLPTPALVPAPIPTTIAPQPPAAPSSEPFPAPTPAPTPEPTPAPTLAPTPSPTIAPTPLPSITPTPAPAPTSSPPSQIPQMGAATSFQITASASSVSTPPSTPASAAASAPVPKMKRAVYLTGFGQFTGVNDNPAQRLVERIAGDGAVADSRVLEVSAAGTVLRLLSRLYAMSRSVQTQISSMIHRLARAARPHACESPGRTVVH